METKRPIELNKVCRRCKREIPEEGFYYRHPKYGIVCEYCPEFEDGGISVLEGEEDEDRPNA